MSYLISPVVALSMISMIFHNDISQILQLLGKHCRFSFKELSLLSMVLAENSNCFPLILIQITRIEVFNCFMLELDRSIFTLAISLLHMVETKSVLRDEYNIVF